MEQMINENKIYNAALYCRLSKDDEQAGESVSIGTQRMILEKFCKEHDFHVFDVYVDDGFSGLNFERPEFRRMLKDIDDGKINLVITKDLSRLGRDYIQTGYYTEVYFQQKQVRYIAVNDGIDTNREDNDIAPFKNILNDMYAKDLSRKVKVAKRQRAYKGLFISAQTPYGYKIDPMDKNHLIVDEEVSDIIKEIFRLALSGKSLVQISRILTENQILTPGSYKAMKGDTRFERYLKDGKSSFSWCYQTVRAILKDRVYVGDMVNHRYEISNYKTKERVSIPAEKHIVVADRHEAIVSREDFERVQQLIRLRHRPKKHEFQNIFHKLTFCAECGHHMTMMMKPLKSGTYPLIRCTNHFQNPEECKHHHQIYYEDLYTEILKSVQGIEYDWDMFKKERVFCMHNQFMPDGVFENGDAKDEGQNPLLHKFREQMSIEDDYFTNEKNHWISKIENSKLLKGIEMLSEEQLELLERAVIKEESLEEISEDMGVGYFAVANRLKRIKKKIKNIYTE